MTFCSRWPRLISSLVIFGLLGGSVFAVTDRTFTTSPTLATEVRTMVKLLSQAHYNRDAIRSSNYAEVIPDYMGSLDGQHMFFLESDRAEFEQRYNTSLYWNVSRLGNIDAAYEIYTIYEQRAEHRVNWIFDQLDAATEDLATNDLYEVDRSKAPWPESDAAADDLWRKRIKFELIAEFLNKKSPDEAKQAVRKRYERLLKNLGDIESSDLAELFLATIARLYDPHSTYFSAETFEDFGIQMKLELVGIGALLGLEDDYCVVKEIIPGGPADLGKQLKPNDRILSVSQEGGESIEIIGMKLRKIVDMIRGEKGSPVHLLVQPGDAPDPSTRRVIIITRDVVKLNSARAHAAIFQVPNLDGKNVPIGVISLPSFYGPAEEGDTDKSSASIDVAKLIEQLKQTGIEGMVLDLRRNGGGFLSEAIDLTGLFIKNGPVVQVKNYAGEIQVDTDESDRLVYDGPLAVLVDKFSASASEIVAGALQNYGRAIVVGDSSTHGKGSVQTVWEMKHFVPQLARSPLKTGATKLTVQKYYLPNGNSTQLKGVIPDIVLPSIQDLLPIGESDLPHALIWDEIPTSFFEGKPLDPELVSYLKTASQMRQESLDEFSYLQRSVDQFKSRQEEKLISLNLESRRAQQVEDVAFRKELKKIKFKLAEQDYTYSEFRVGPPLPEPIKAEPVIDESESDDEEDLLSTDDNDAYAKVDVHLKECLRVVNDAISLAKNKQDWVSNRPPLTAAMDDRN